MKNQLALFTLFCFAILALVVRPANAGGPPIQGDTKPPANPPTGIEKVSPVINTTALALSGGGAKGSFQVGALRYLYDQVFAGEEPLPQIIAGTSVGAVNGAKLAEGGRASFDQLESIWLGLQKDSDMYEPNEWFQTLTSFQRKLLREFGDAGFGDFVGTFFEVLFQNEVADTDIDKIESALARAQDQYALYHLGPLAAIMNGGALRPDKIQASKIKLRLAVVNLHDGRLRYVTEAGRMLERDYQPANWTNLPGRNEFIPPPCTQISNNAKEALKALDQLSGAEKAEEVETGPQKGGVGTKMQNAEYEKEYQEIMKPLRDCLTKNPIVSMLSAVLASSAIPAIFEPIRMLGGLYVDGGVREVVPVQVAVDLGADKVYAIVAGRRESQPPDYIKNIPDVALRALNITLDEVVRNETERTDRWQDKPVVVIAPNHEVHDALTIQPGLIRIGMAYGYMRAADTIESGSTDKRQKAIELADEIARRRELNFKGEKEYADQAQLLHFKDIPNPGGPASDKRAIRKLVRERLQLGFSVPPNIERSWLSWECHATAQYLPRVWPAPDPSNVPPACVSLKGQLKQLEQASTPTTQGPDGPKPGKPDFDPESKSNQEEIKKLRLQLKQCIADNTPPDPVRHGLLVKAGSSPDVYVIYGGSKLKLRGTDPIKEMRYDPKDVLVVPQKVLDRMPSDQPANGTLIGNNKGEVFRMEKGKKKSIPAPAVPEYYSPKNYKDKFTSFDQEAWEVRLVPEETLKAIP